MMSLEMGNPEIAYLFQHEVCEQEFLLVICVHFCQKMELVFLLVCVQVVRRRKLSAARIWQPLQLLISCQKGTAILMIPLASCTLLHKLFPPLFSPFSTLFSLFSLCTAMG